MLQVAKLDEIDGVKKVVKPCTLDKETQALIKLIFDQDMFKEAMATMEIGKCLTLPIFKAHNFRLLEVNFSVIHLH